jgi:hypothetical protein
LDVQDTEIAS